MNLQMSSSGYWLIGSLLAILLLLPFLLPELVGTMPHAHCYLWRSDLMWLHGGSDGLIGLAYMAISITLFTLLYQIRRAIPFRWMIFAFGAFIIACGLTHFLNVWTLWEPVYYLSGSVKGVTALASIITAVTLPPLVPRIINVVNAARKSEERRKELEVLYSRVRRLDEERSRFFANISHDLRTPITLIRTPIETLLERDDLPTDVRNRLEVVRRNTLSLNERVDDLFDLTRLEANTLHLHEEETDLSLLVRRLVGNFQGAADYRSVTLPIEAPPRLMARVDRRKIERVLQNVVGNAMRYVPDGGEVKTRILVSSQGITLEVIDNGPGIPPGDRERLLERFTQGPDQGEEYRGSGLGLAIARSFMELHGGSLTIDDAPQGGALLRMRIPRDRLLDSYDVTQARQTETGQISLSDRGRTLPDVVDTPPSDRPIVLLVEDNPEMRQYTTEVLERDLTVVQAASAEEGLAILERVTPAVVVSDIMMPGMGGEEFLRKIRDREDLKNLPVIFLSAREEEEMRVHLLRNGAQDYLSKPFSPSELRTRVAGFVAIEQYQQALRREVSEKEESLSEATTELEQRRRLLEEVLSDLREVENRFDLLWNSNVVAMGISHFDGRISEANDRFLAMIGYSREELHDGQISVRGITHQDSIEKTDRAITTLRSDGRINAFEKVYVHRSGREVPAFVGAAKMEGSEANIFIALDLSEMREAEQKIRELNEELEQRVEQRTRELRDVNRDLRAFSYSVSHDLRAPLRAIEGFARFLREDYREKLDDTGRDYLSRIERNVGVMEEMISALLGLSRATREPIQAEVHDVRDSIDEIVTSLRAADPERTVQFEVAPSLMIEADRKLFRVVLENLLHNAWKFTKKEPDARIEISSEELEGSWVLRVSDNGAGFDTENSERMFEPFGQLHSRSEFGGTGIGLATVQAVIRRHSGRISAQGVPGEGATITITLPRPAEIQQEEIDGE